MKAQKLGILAGFIASVCCLGPLLLIILGLGSLGLGAVIGKFHLFFLVAGLIIIILAWSLYFKEKNKCLAKACEMPNKKTTQLILLIATFAVVFFASLNLYTRFNKTNIIHPAASITNLENISIEVEGLTCFSCEFAVSSALKNLDGVFGVIVSAKDGKAKISYDPDKTDLKQLFEAIDKTGFKAKI